MLLKATQVTVLLRCLDARGIIRIPVDDIEERGYFGITKSLDASQSIAGQLIEHVAKRIDRPDLIPRIEVLTTVEPVLEREGYAASLLYLMRIDPRHFLGSESWPTLMSGLKAMPAGRPRLAYNKAMQYFAGAADAQVDVLELDEQVRRRLAEIMAQKPSTLLD